MALRAFLELPNGVAVRIGAGGLLVGRHRGCDVQLVDKSASRRHALLRIADDGIELMVLGRRPVQVGDRACADVEPLRDGQTLRFPGLVCRVRLDQADESVRPVFCLRRGSERLLIHSTPFVVGGGADAHVAVAGCAVEALRFRVAQGILHVEATSADASLDGAPLEPDATTPLEVGSVVTCCGESFEIEHADAGDASTVVTSGSALPTRVVLQPLPRGGRVTFTFSDGERAVYFPGRRFQLVAALLAPPPPHLPGDFVPDHALIPLVWSAHEIAGRQDVNVLLTRCRRDLVAAGIAPGKIIDRAPGGHATRIALAANAEIRTLSE